MIELRHLRTLMALKESGSLVGAAKKRFVTQSALSHQLKELELKIDSAIFVRKSTPPVFTPEGLLLLQLAEAILPRVLAAEAQLRKGLETEEKTLLVGIECHSCFRWLMPVMGKFREAHPQAEVELSSRHQFDSLDALEAGELDIVLTSDPVPGHALEYRHLFDFEVKLVVAKDHPLAREAHVTPGQLARLPILSYPVPLARLDLYRHFLAPAGIEAGIQKHCDLTPILLQRIACQEGIAALPSWSIREGHGLSLATVRLGEQGLSRPLYGAYRRHSVNAELILDWLQLLVREGVQICDAMS